VDDRVTDEDPVSVGVGGGVRVAVADCVTLPDADRV
jgi:hypothetical protein